MKISQNGINFIKQWEKFEPKEYKCPAGKITIGYGHVLMRGESYSHLTGGISEHLATNFLMQDLKPVEDTINKNVKVPLTQNQFDALCSLIYNIGSGAFNKSKGLILLNEDQLKAAQEEFFSLSKGFVNIHGLPSNGLINRRKAEAKLWLS